MSQFSGFASSYIDILNKCFSANVIAAVEQLADELLQVWTEGRHVYICGNGGSAANAIHIANDLHYGIGACGLAPAIPGLKIEALPSNVGIVTCLANDTGYENVFSHQLQVKASPGDLLIVLSGSGNSSNVIKALEAASLLGMKSCAIVAFSGGRCREMADFAIHFPIDDMQIAEDTQLIVGHLCMKWLSRGKPSGMQSLF